MSAPVALDGTGSPDGAGYDQPLRIPTRLGLGLLCAAWLLSWLLSLGLELGAGPAMPPFLAEADPAGGYPTVVDRAYQEEPLPPEAPRAGDVLVGVGGRDLRGAGVLVASVALVGRTDERNRVEVRFLRDGEERVEQLQLERQPRMWRNLIGSLCVAVVALFALWRAPRMPAARAFAVACLAWGTHLAFFFGRSEGQVLLGVLAFTLGGFLFFGAALRTVLLFPPGLARFDAPARILPWLLALTALGLSMHNFGFPPPHSLGLPLAFGGNAVLAGSVIGVLAWRYRRSQEDARRQLRWVALGLYVVVIPQLVAFVLVAFRPDWLRIVDLLWTLNLLLPPFLLVAIIRHHLFDIDRLVTSAVAYSVLGVALFAALFALVPLAAERLEGWTGLPTDTSRLALSVLVAAVVFPAQQALRPRLERWFFPERQRLERAFDALGDDLAGKQDPIDMLRLLVGGLSEVLGLERAAALALGAGGPVRVAEVGRVSTGFLSEQDQGRLARSYRALPVLQDRQVWLPIRRAGELVAAIWLGPKRSGDGFSVAELALLTALSQRASSELARLHGEEILAAVEARALELRHQKEVAERSIEERSRQLAGASHDLRQPLHALSLLIEGLAERAEDEDTREMVERISASSQTLEEMFTGLLDLSRLEAGDAGGQLGPVALQPMLERLASELDPVARAKGLRFAVLARDVHVLSEPVMLRRIVGNLVHNALRYTEHGSVVVAVRGAGDQVRIEVRDSGPGIPADEQEAIFEAFHRSASARASAEGLGLGLAVVRGLADALGHRIGLRSALGRGSVFHVSAARVEPAPRVALAPRPGVALIDLEPDERRQLSGLLEDWGFDVAPPARGPAAWLVAARSSGDLRARLDRLCVLHGDAPAVVALLDEAAGARPFGDEQPVFALPRPAPPARLRSLLMHLTRRAAERGA